MIKAFLTNVGLMVVGAIWGFAAIVFGLITVLSLLELFGVG